MQVDLYGRNFSGFTTLLTFVVLNVVYLLCCLPVVTIGAATSALVEVTYRYADEERGNLLKDYFAALARNFSQATVAFFLFLVPAALLGFAASFWFQYDSPFSTAASLLAVIGCVYLLAAFLYAVALVATHTNATRQLLKNSLLLPMAEAFRTLLLLLIPVTCIALIYVVPGFIYVMLTIGCAMAAYGSALVLRKIFARR